VHTPPSTHFETARPSIELELGSTDEFDRRYAERMALARPGDAYGLALANQTLGLLRGDPALVARARELYEESRDATNDPRARECASLGELYTRRLLAGIFPPHAGTPADVEPVRCERVDPPRGSFTKIVLGRSAIHVARGARVKTQADRVVRDWLLGHTVERPPWTFTLADRVTWHEGEKLAQLVELAGVHVIPVWGTRATRVGEKWYAPDSTGAPRFEISPDKIENYPSTIFVDDRTAIVNDTHGISAIAWDALDADLVVGCGDHPGKMDAAYWLAERNVDVYVPTDRFLGLLMGARTKGTIVGSAPIRREGDGAVIGDRPVAIGVDEAIVVSTAKSDYPIRYYDTPLRYFTALAEFCGRKLDVTAVEVTEYGHAEPVVAEARRRGAKVIGIRVKSAAEHDAVAAWLAEDASRRAVLFHTALYPDGCRLFDEFPAQTTFGDIRPAFE
jgi:hypothetical protein